MDNKNRMQTSFADYLSALNPLLASALEPVADEQFDQLARRLFALQFEHVQLYRAFCLARGITPASLPNWAEIPAVPNASFKEFDWTSLPPADRTRVFHSSGTTAGTSSRNFHDEHSLALYERSLLAWAREKFIAYDTQRFDLLFLTPDPKGAPHSSLVHMFETLRRASGCADSRYAGACDDVGRWIVLHDLAQLALANAQSTSRPIAIFGTAFSFVEWLDQLALSRTRYELPPGSRILETGGYKGRSRVLPKSQLYRQLTETFGVPSPFIVSEYGMCELSSQAYDHHAGMPASGRVYQFPPWTRAVVIDPDTNTAAKVDETGLLRVFDLANVQSVMAIQTDDLARRSRHGFVLLGRAPAAEARGCSLLSR
jgi:hypothetical protein